MNRVFSLLLIVGFATALFAQEKRVEDYLDKWMEEDVLYIVTPQEREVFKKLTTAEEKERFIEQFWLRRDPTPGTMENEFKEEHYRRIAYANEQFPAGIPGWKTDRGRIYIIHGPPDQIEDHPVGETYHRPSSEGGGSTATFPWQVWRYRYLEGIGNEIKIEFVDRKGGGLYEIARDEYDKDALFHVPGAGLTEAEALGLATKTPRVAQRYMGDPEQKYRGTGINYRMSDAPFERLHRYALMNRPPAIRFRDLEAVVTSKISYRQLPFDFRFDLTRAGANLALVPLTIAVDPSNLSFVAQETVERATVHVYGRVETPARQIAYEFEDVIAVETAAGAPPTSRSNASRYQKNVPLRPGRYKLNLVLKDANSGHLGTLETSLVVPDFPERTLAASTPILADKIRPARGEQRPDPFVTESGYKVYPNVRQVFAGDQVMGVYLEIYNAQMDQATSQPDVAVDTRCYRWTANGKVEVEAARINASQTSLSPLDDKVVVMKFLSLKTLAPGEYGLTLDIHDKVANKRVVAEARFTVTAHR